MFLSEDHQIWVEKSDPDLLDTMTTGKQNIDIAGDVAPDANESVENDTDSENEFDVIEIDSDASGWVTDCAPEAQRLVFARLFEASFSAPLSAQLLLLARLFQRSFFYWRSSFSVASSICAPFLWARAPVRLGALSWQDLRVSPSLWKESFDLASPRGCL